MCAATVTIFDQITSFQIGLFSQGFRTLEFCWILLNNLIIFIYLKKNLTFQSRVSSIVQELFGRTVPLSSSCKTKQKHEIKAERLTAVSANHTMLGRELNLDAARRFVAVTTCEAEAGDGNNTSGPGGGTLERCVCFASQRVLPVKKMFLKKRSFLFFHVRKRFSLSGENQRWRDSCRSAPSIIRSEGADSTPLRS